MKIQEYQAKQLLKNFGISIPQSKIASTLNEVIEAGKRIGGNKWIIKAQITAGSRMKAGGIKIAQNLSELRDYSNILFNTNLTAQQTGLGSQFINQLLVEQFINVKKEIYLSITMDLSLSRNVLIACAEGGIDIEELAIKSPEKIIKEIIDPSIGLQEIQTTKIIKELGLQKDLFEEMKNLIDMLYRIYESCDLQLLEINPLAITDNNQLIALDAKIIIDDNALFRHAELQELKNIELLDTLEKEAEEANLSYVKLKGNIGCMVNGAGLAMATMDLIKLAGGEPANFLDIGGNANKEKVEKGMRILLKNPNIKVILINIFGGIVHCDKVAKGIIEAIENIEVKIPIIIRLAGTNAEQGLQILRTSKFNFTVASHLKEAVDLTIKSIN